MMEAKESKREGFGAREGMEKVELGGELGFSELGRMEMREQEYVGNTVGLYRGVRGEGVEETFVAVPSKKGGAARSAIRAAEGRRGDGGGAEAEPGRGDVSAREGEAEGGFRAGVEEREGVGERGDRKSVV